MTGAAVTAITAAVVTVVRVKVATRVVVVLFGLAVVHGRVRVVVERETARREEWGPLGGIHGSNSGTAATLRAHDGREVGLDVGDDPKGIEKGVHHINVVWQDMQDVDGVWIWKG